jgi:sugar phosphate isomerase/epimerase
MERDPIALELYTVRDQLQEHFAETVREVAELGYPAVEFAGYGGLSAAEMASLLRETRLEAAGTHVSLDALRKDLDGQIAYCREISCSYLVVPAAPRGAPLAEALPKLATELNEMGHRCRREGIFLGYHNHDFEFQEVDGQPLLEHLMAETDPQAVTFELDVYWAAFAGHDPVAFLERHAERIAILHMKDMDAERRYTEVGEGTLDMAGLCRMGRETGVRWYIVEHDEPRMPSLESARISLRNLRSLLSGEEAEHGR